MTAGPRAGRRIGLVGCGVFGSFVARTLSGLPGVPGADLVAVADANPALAGGLARELGGVDAADGLDGLVHNHDLDVVIIATPPYSHADLAVRALEAGCHVLVEKPLAIDLAGCDRVAAAERENDRVVAVDHMLRFAPLVLVLEHLLAVEVDGRRILGPVRRFSFENDAADDELPPGHWFWDTDRSGGIFIEHGVHFFDLAASLVGSAADTIQAVMIGLKPDRPFDTVCATATFAGGATATWYHSFTHTRRGERQRLRLDLGLAECRLDGWIPLDLRLDALVDADGASALEDAIADARVIGSDVPVRELSTETGRVRLRLAHAGPDAKRKVYAQCVVDLVGDLLAAIDHRRSPRVGVDEATAAVALASAAVEAAASGRTVSLPSSG